MTPSRLPNSPLREIIFAVEFEGANFSSVHWGMYWEHIREEFPEYLDAPPMLKDDYSSSLPPLRGGLFISENRKQIIQLQDSAFIYQCIDLAPDETLDFEPLFQEFLKKWQQFKQWWSDLAQTSIYPIIYRLSYNNIIDQDSGWLSPKDNPKVFTFINESSTWKNPHKTLGMFDCQLYFELPQSLGILQVSIDQREKDDEHESNFLLFNLWTSQAKSSDEDTSNEEHFDGDKGLQTWFNLAHENLVKYFFDLTENKVQQIWRQAND